MLQPTNFPEEPTIIINPPRIKAGRRTVVLPDNVVASLRGYRKRQKKEHMKKGIRTSHVIHNQKGEFYRPAAYSAAVKLAGNKAGIVSLGPHSLRHLHVTYLMEQGIHTKVGQERLGHSSMVTTLQVYSQVLDTMQDEAAEKAGVLCLSLLFYPT
ncbi:MAG: tyrosine-type recombinase/integrase [Gammaproteobacteria bacterium]|nr:tyrosine-type recombinase/integrase [Gammaproteobacteria bacterium]